MWKEREGEGERGKEAISVESPPLPERLGCRAPSPNAASSERLASGKRRRRKRVEEIKG